MIHVRNVKLLVAIFQTAPSYFGAIARIIQIVKSVSLDLALNALFQIEFARHLIVNFMHYDVIMRITHC